MNYQEFKKIMIEEFKNYLPEKYRSWKVTAKEMNKVNLVEDILCLSEGKSGEAVPIVYIEKYYRKVERGVPVETVMMEAAEEFLAGMEYLKNMDNQPYLDYHCGEVIFVLVNTEKNKEMLKDVPHRNIMDLSIIYRLMIEIPGDGFNSAIITNELADSMEMTEEMLYHKAMENTPVLMPSFVANIGNTFVLICNERKVIGAGVMLYDGVLEKVAESLSDDLYILPASIHEVYAVPASRITEEKVKEAVYDGNRSVVEKNEILSDNVYYYSRENKELSMVNG